MFRNRNFMTLLSGQFISTFGNNLFSIALPWYVYTITQSKSDLSFVGVAQSLPAILGLFAGVFVDRWAKRKTMVYSDVIRMLLCVVLAVLALFHANLWPIVILVFVMRCVGNFFGPAAASLLPMVVKEEEIPTAMGWDQSGTATAQLAGTLSGGFLLTLLSAPLLFIGDAVSFFLSVASLFLIRLKEARPETAINGRTSSFRREFFDGLAMFGKSRFLILTLCAALVVNCAVAPFDLALTAWVKGPLHGSAFQLGIINASFFVGIIVGGISLGRIVRLLPLRFLFFASLILAGTCVCCVGLYPNSVWDSALGACFGYVIGTINGAFSSVTVNLIPAEARGRAFGAIGALFSLSAPLGMALGGIWMTHFTLTDVFIWMGIPCIVAGIGFLLPVPEDLHSIRSSKRAAIEG